MYLSERHIIKRSHKHYDELDHLCFLSKNLYNQSLYRVKQQYFENGSFLTFFDLDKQLIRENQIDYRSLPAKVAKMTVKLVDQNYRSFFGFLKLKDGKAKIPKYLDKVKGRQVVIYDRQAISAVELRKGYIKLSGTNVLIKTKVNPEKVKQVRVVPKRGHIVIEVIYEITTQELLKDNGRYCSIDLGINNLATVGSNVISPFIINGKPLKSINQYYNKRKAQLQSKLPKDHYTSHRIKAITLIRENRINDYLHRSSRYIINQLVSNNINTLIIGYNKGWKQEINIGKVNNQKFISIPYLKFVQMLEYKAKLAGINVIIHEESYTSKCSFLDNEPVQKHEKYLGKRIKRGLFKSSKGKLINADLNGSLNILKKVIGEFKYPIEVCSTPRVLTLKQQECL